MSPGHTAWAVWFQCREGWVGRNTHERALRGPSVQILSGRAHGRELRRLGGLWRCCILLCPPPDHFPSPRPPVVRANPRQFTHLLCHHQLPCLIQRQSSAAVQLRGAPLAVPDSEGAACPGAANSSRATCCDPSASPQSPSAHSCGHQLQQPARVEPSPLSCVTCPASRPDRQETSLRRRFTSLAARGRESPDKSSHAAPRVQQVTVCGGQEAAPVRASTHT